MAIELVETTKEYVQQLYQYLFTSAPGSLVDLSPYSQSPLYFSLSSTGDLTQLFTGHGAAFVSRLNPWHRLELNLNNTDDGEDKRHSFFFASSFVREVMDYYWGVGKDVNGFDCIWEPGTTNYRTYWGLINSGYDAHTATINTWTGRLASTYSFSPQQYPRNEYIDGQWVLTAKFGYGVGR